MDPFVALADPVRRALLVRLHAGTARVVDLAAEHDVSRPAISRHLRVLGEAGLVSAEDRGRERHYRLEPAGLRPVERYVAELAGTAGTDGASADDPRTDAVRARPPVPVGALDGLDLEVRRTVREQAPRPDRTAEQQEETA